MPHSRRIYFVLSKKVRFTVRNQNHRELRGAAIQPGRHWSLRLNGVKTALDAARDGTGVAEIDESITSPSNNNDESKPFKEVAVDIGNLLSQHQQKPSSFNAPVPSSQWSPSQNYGTLRRPVARNNSAIGLVNNGSSSLTDNEFIIPRHKSGVNLRSDEREDFHKGTYKPTAGLKVKIKPLLRRLPQE